MECELESLHMRKGRNCDLTNGGRRNQSRLFVSWILQRREILLFYVYASKVPQLDPGEH